MVCECYGSWSIVTALPIGYVHVCGFRGARLSERPLQGVSVFLAGRQDSAYIRDWKSILIIANAVVVKKISANSGQWHYIYTALLVVGEPSVNTDMYSITGVKPDLMMVSSEGCSQHHLTQAHRLGIPCVSPEFAIQQLITGRSVPHNYHPSFTGNTRPMKQ